MTNGMTDHTLPVSSNPKGPIVFFATPAYGGVQPRYVLSLVNAMRELARLGYRTMLYFSEGCSIITNAREELLGAFLASGADLMAGIDGDIGFPADAIPRMIALNEAVTACAVPYRTIDAQKIEAGTYIDGVTFNTTPSSPEDLAKRPQKNGFVSVESVGTGFFLIRRDAVLGMMRRYADLEIVVSGFPSYALFSQGLDKQNKKHLGEDTSFFARWVSMGGSIWCLMDAEITHTGPIHVGGNLARKMTGEIDPASRFLAGGMHVTPGLKRLPPQAAAPPPAPPPAPAPVAPAVAPTPETKP